MAKSKLTDKERKKIIAEYIDCGNYSAVARKFGISVNTVKRTVNNDKNTANKCKHKKEQNTLDMLAYLDSKKSVVQNIINNALDLLTKEKLEEASPRELMTVVAIAMDKFVYDRLNKVEKPDDDTSFENNRKTFADLITKDRTVKKDE